MSRTKKFVVSFALLPLAASAVMAQTATHVLTFQVSAINQVSVTGTPSLTINAAVAGSAPTLVTATGSTYSVTTNQSTAKITAAIDVFVAMHRLEVFDSGKVRHPLLVPPLAKFRASHPPPDHPHCRVPLRPR